MFLAACELGADERNSFLNGECGGEDDLRHEVEALLAFDRPADTAPEEIRPPQYIGNFRLLQKLGEGGMGEVWEAEQARPVGRRVALKLIKWGMDTKEVLARFESERQALALMNHPNIAGAFEAGSTDDGRPFFAMEYVRGVPLTEYCDAQRLSTHERLKLFVKVCEGVQHAHQKGIIHRDIKPSNILVAVEDGRPVPKIIDFGVAKATSQRLTERTLFTELGQWIGTPEYMSPEQAELSGLDVDTRSDVYSLGVVLYELLAGAQP
ncbi:MAG: serine/threonine-protein kinase, partial [Acidobacteriota bacterium]